MGAIDARENPIESRNGINEFKVRFTGRSNSISTPFGPDEEVDFDAVRTILGVADDYVRLPMVAMQDEQTEKIREDPVRIGLLK